MQLNAQRNTTEADIIQHFRSGGALTAETAVLCAAIRDIVINGKRRQ